jgi:hypothetical protein
MTQKGSNARDDPLSQGAQFEQREHTVARLTNQLLRRIRSRIISRFHCGTDALNVLYSGNLSTAECDQALQARTIQISEDWAESPECMQSAYADSVSSS